MNTPTTTHTTGTPYDDAFRTMLVEPTTADQS